jgi:hypothetical protein
LDVVWVAKGQHRVLGVRWFLDTRVCDPVLVESGRPFVEVLAAVDQEFQMVEAGAILAERVAWIRRVFHEAQDQPAAWFRQAVISDAPIGRTELVARLHPEQRLIPGRALCCVANREASGRTAQRRGWRSERHRDVGPDWWQRPLRQAASLVGRSPKRLHCRPPLTAGLREYARCGVASVGGAGWSTGWSHDGCAQLFGTNRFQPLPFSQADARVGPGVEMIMSRGRES